jgi:tetratricopeptide (TPR) repeat protein
MAGEKSQGLERPDGASFEAKRFRVAFSFVGEKREFVAKVAEILAGSFGKKRILYDKFHEAEFARGDLGIRLPDLYHDQSDLIVVVVCPEYDEREWTGLEWLAIHDLLKNRRYRDVMLCRFERAMVKGIHSNAGWIELDGKTPEEAANLILKRLACNEGKPENDYTRSSHAALLETSIRNNLPRLQSFFGRTQELQQIREALDPENRTWGELIDGPGGVGKTSLAVRAAYECQPGQFQRIIFLSVKDRELDDDGVRELGTFILRGSLEMLNELARELGEPEIAKAPEDQRVRLLLDALRPAKALLVLDNLESLPKSDRDQIFTFVKHLPQGCKAILTSRGRIGSGSEELILERLDQVAALATLADLARHNKLLAKTDESQRIALYEQTGGNPLLLRWVAGQLGRGSCRNLADALQFLGACPPGNDPLEFIFGDLVEGFTSAEMGALGALTYFSLPARVKHVAEVAELDEASTSAALHSLANRSLVVPDQEEKAFTLVPMVAEFLRRKRPVIVTQIGNQLANRALALIVENGDRNYSRFPILDAAWPQLAAALSIFLTGPYERLKIVCNSLDLFFDYTGRWDEWFSLEQQAEAKAIASSDYRMAGYRAAMIGWIFHLRARADEVLSCADRAEAHWRKAQAGPDEHASVFRLRGLAYQMKGNSRAAVTAYREALEVRRPMFSSTPGVASALNDLATAEKDSGDIAAAERDYGEGLLVARRVGDAEGLAVILGNLAGLRLDQKEWPAAEALSRQALQMSEKVGRQELIASDCKRLASALARQGKKADGLPHAQRAVEIYTNLRSPCLKDAVDALRACWE